ncbi:MAG TPA: hypothetical protein PLU50_05885, partial [Pseudobdellovibrionaceae bacterium]|nr:hypothetical protein [Pseudobdellovibrionaceae bacterium]
LYARQGKYEKAAEAYEAAGKSNKASPDSASLLYNAAILNQALGRNNAAINSYNEFLVVNRAPADQADALFSTATLYRKSGNLANAKSRYLEFLKTGQGKADQVIEAQYYLGQIAEKVGDKGLAQKYWNDMVGSYRRSKGQVTPSGAKYVALVKYEELKKDLSAYISIRLPADPKLQKTVNDDKINRLLGISQKINNLVLIESPEHIVNRLIALGDANFDMYSTLVKAPLPKGLTADETTRYKAGIEGLARSFFDKGMEGYKAGVAKARELQAYTPEYMKALKFMSTQDPQAYPDSGVAGMDVRLVNWVVK